jgi:hypothetical protein
MWTHFMDMHSGGGQKLDWSHIFIEAPQGEAESIFYAMFGRNPNRVTCTCCGEDYSISEHESLEQATGFERGCAYEYTDAEGNSFGDDIWYKLPIEKRRELKGRYVERTGPKAWKAYCTLDDYLATGKVKTVRASEIAQGMADTPVPEEGYVWAGE